jgi:hypothetical protein
MIKTLKLYHYTDQNIKDKLKVSYYGKNYFTSNDVKITAIKRLFFYAVPCPEYLLDSSEYCYIVNYPINRIYDLTIDREGFLKNNSIDGALRQIKYLGYSGIKYNIGADVIYNLFYDVKIAKQIKRF